MSGHAALLNPLVNSLVTYVQIFADVIDSKPPVFHSLHSSNLEVLSKPEALPVESSN